MSIRRLVALFSLLLAPAVLTAGDQFTFSIPYKAQKLMPNVKSLRVVCAVFPKKPTIDEKREWWGWASGYTEKFVPVGADGSASGTATVGVNVKAGVNPGDAVYYFCFVDLSNAPGKGGSTWGLTAAGEPGYEKFTSDKKAAPGTPLVTMDEGWLPGKAPK